MPDVPTRPKRPSSSQKNDLALVELIRDCEDLEKEVENIRKALWGVNGNVGMVGRLSKVEDIISDIKKVAMAILGVLLGLSLGGLYQAIVHAAK